MMQLHRVTPPDGVHAALESRRPHPAGRRLVSVERSTRPADERALSGLKSAAFGAVSGCLATIPMTATMTMAAGYSALPQNEHDSLPPRQITMKLAQAVGVVHKMDELERVEATAATHFAYGTLMGGVFGALVRGRVRPDVETGIAFGLTVWAGSYLGLLPALGLLSPATQHPTNRNLLMMGAHVVWAAALACTQQRLLTTDEQSNHI